MRGCYKKHKHMHVNCHKNEKRYLKEFCKVDKLCLKKCKKPIKEVLESFIKVIIKSCRIIETCFGKRIIIKGYKIIKIHYVASGKSGKVLSECFCVPFFKFIPINCNHHMKVCDITAGLEFSQISKCTDRCILLYALIFICVKVKKSCSYNKPIDYYHCEITPQCYCDNRHNIDFKNDYIKEREQYLNSSYCDL